MTGIWLFFVAYVLVCYAITIYWIVSESLKIKCLFDTRHTITWAFIMVMLSPVTLPKLIWESYKITSKWNLAIERTKTAILSVVFF